MSELSDQDIIDQFQAGMNKEQAFKRLVIKYQEKIYWHIRRIVITHEDADDLVQETFVKVWKNLDKFRGDSKLYTWIYRIATNESISFINGQKRRFLIPIVEAMNKLDEALHTDPYFNGDEAQLKLQQAILKLPEKQRIVFNMKYFEEMKYEEMAEVLNTSVGALKASYHHAVRKIEDELNAD